MAITEASVPKVIKTSHDKTKNSHYPTVLHHTRTGNIACFFQPVSKIFAEPTKNTGNFY